jgi:hypothetical protein
VSARIRAALPRNSSEPESMLDSIGTRFPLAMHYTHHTRANERLFRVEQK